MTLYFSIGLMEAARLTAAAMEHGAGEAEFAAIARLEEGRAEQVDIERLDPLAKLADLPWQSLFPEVYADKEMRRASGLASKFLEIPAGEEAANGDAPPTAIVLTALALAMIAYENAAPVGSYTTEQSVEKAFEMAKKIQAQMEADGCWEHAG